MEWIHVALVFQIFVLANPLASVPMILTAYKKKFNVKKIAVYAVFIAFLVAVAINFIGPFLFSIFGITLDSFRIAGGLILLFLAGETILHSEKEDSSGFHKVDSLISIIATPLLTGPATMSFVTIKAFELGSFNLLPTLVVSFILVGVVFFLLALAVPKINTKVIDISSKIFGLFLIAMAIELIIIGIKGAFLV